MIRLRQLGGVALEGPHGLLTGAPAQRHRLALLVLLARSAPAPLSRDKLMALLWPEHDTRSARRLLNLSIHVLRRALGPAAIRSAGDAVALATGLVEDDVATFEAAAGHRDPSAAIRAYAGPFLDGLFLPRAPEFDRWAADLRTRLADRYAGLLERVAREAERNAAWNDAVDAWRRLVSLDPGNGPAVRQLMLALDARHDRAGALAEARSHARYMREEFGADPDAEVERLGRSLVASPPVRGLAPAPEGGIAVLPLVEVGTGDAEHRLGDGLAIALMERLTRVSGLPVVSAAAAFAVRGRGFGVREIGVALRADWLVDGSVRRVGERARVTVHLLDARDASLRWSGSYERRVRDPFAVEEELADEIGGALASELGGAGAGALDLDTRGLILRGRLALSRPSLEGVLTARRYFSVALSRAPGEAAGHAGLAEAYALAGFHEHLAPAEAFGAARQAARAALRLERHNVAARTTLACTDLYFRWNQSLAEQRFQRVLRQAPMSSMAHQWYGNLLVATGRGADAVRSMTRAASLDPQSLVAGAAVGWALYHQGRHEEAVARCQAILDLDPGCAVAHLWQGLAWQELGEWPDAIAALRRVQALFGGSRLATAALARALAAAGQPAEAHALLDPLLLQPDYLPSYEIAKALLALGRPAEALAWLERAHRERSHSMVYLAVDPQLERLRGLPRFRALMPPRFDQAS